ncbi:MAG: pyrC 2 [Deltaproteobacteria bacterium]|nr:pyrC 2 [Deltaproteobacteria bacterium]
MKYLFSGATVCTADGISRCDILVDHGKVAAISPLLSSGDDVVVIDAKEYYLFPGFVDVHVHLREPGFSFKETFASGTMAAARGGYTTVCTMPNLSPAPDSLEHLEVQLALIRSGAKVHVHPYGTITVGEKGRNLADLEDMAPYVVGFSDDGRGVQADGLMELAMRKTKKLSKIIVAHCEDEALVRGGYIHEGAYAKAHGHLGICSESEWRQVARDLELVRKTGCAYHVCHVSTKESVALLRQAKAEGLDVTCETAPHYLVLTEEDLQEEGRFKMNPPLREREDQDALLEGLLDGTIDMIATDHAPHGAEEKDKGLKGSLMGVVGLETAFPVLYTKLVKTGRVPLPQLIRWLSENPARRFGIGSHMAVGMPADITLFDLNRDYIIDPSEFQTQGRSTPFTGLQVWGRCKLTMVDGTIVWEE